MIIIKYNDVILLKCISRNISLSVLKDRGLTYAQIVMGIKKLVNNGFIEYNDGDILVVTETGYKAIREFDNSVSDKEQRWIFPQLNKRTEPLKTFEVVLPKNKTVLK